MDNTLAIIETTEHFTTALSDNKADTYQAPYYITKDGGALSQESAEENSELIQDAIRNDDHDQWRVTHKLINWEDHALTCDHSNQLIESVY